MTLDHNLHKQLELIHLHKITENFQTVSTFLVVTATNLYSLIAIKLGIRELEMCDWLSCNCIFCGRQA